MAPLHFNFFPLQFVRLGSSCPNLLEKDSKLFFFEHPAEPTWHWLVMQAYGIYTCGRTGQMHFPGRFSSLHLILQSLICVEDSKRSLHCWHNVCTFATFATPATQSIWRFHQVSPRLEGRGAVSYRILIACCLLVSLFFQKLSSTKLYQARYGLFFVHFDRPANSLSTFV